MSTQTHAVNGAALRCAARALDQAAGGAAPVMLEAVLSTEAALRDVRCAIVATMRTEAGYSWQRVADALGVSKQGAMKVYGAAADAALRAAVRQDRTTEAIPVRPDAGRLVQLAPSTPVAAPGVDVPLFGEPEQRCEPCGYAHRFRTHDEVVASRADQPCAAADGEDEH